MRSYDPFKDFIVLKDTLRAMEDGLSSKEIDGVNVWTPKVDVGETDKCIIVRCELPGVEKDQIKIDITGDTLSISGERKWNDDQDIKYHKIERFYGAFNRTFKIGIPIDQDNIKATYKNGVLEIVVPKAEKLAQKKIEISS